MNFKKIALILLLVVSSIFLVQNTFAAESGKDYKISISKGLTSSSNQTYGESNYLDINPDFISFEVIYLDSKKDSTLYDQTKGQKSRGPEDKFKFYFVDSNNKSFELSKKNMVRYQTNDSAFFTDINVGEIIQLGGKPLKNLKPGTYTFKVCYANNCDEVKNLKLEDIKPKNRKVIDWQSDDEINDKNDSIQIEAYYPNLKGNFEFPTVSNFPLAFSFRLGQNGVWEEAKDSTGYTLGGVHGYSNVATVIEFKSLAYWGFPAYKSGEYDLNVCYTDKYRKALEDSGYNPCITKKVTLVNKKGSKTIGDDNSNPPNDNSDEDKTFEKYKIKTEIKGDGKIEGLKNEYSKNTEAKLTALPDDGYEFLKWEGACVGTGLECVLKMDKNKTVSVTFVKKEIKNETGTGTLENKNDFNKDKKVDAKDLQILQNQIEKKKYLATFDLNKDDVLDVKDIRILRNSFATGVLRVDLNQDGKITQKDVTVLQEQIEKKKYLAILDLNADGILDAKDFLPLAEVSKNIVIPYAFQINIEDTSNPSGDSEAEKTKLPFVSRVTAKAGDEFEVYAGESIGIEGRNLLGTSRDTRVFIGNTEAVVTQYDKKVVYFRAPNLAPGTYNLTVKTSVGTSNTVEVFVKNNTTVQDSSSLGKIQIIEVTKPKEGDVFDKSDSIAYSWTQTLNSKKLKTKIINPLGEEMYSMDHYDGWGTNNRKISSQALEALKPGMYILKVCDYTEAQKPACGSSALFSINAKGEAVQNKPLDNKSQSIVIKKPNGGEVYKIGDELMYTWDQRLNSKELKIDVVEASSNKSVYQVKRYDAAGTNTKTITKADTLKIKEGSYKLRICDVVVDGSPVCDLSDSSFSFSSTTADFASGTRALKSQSITIKTPNGGESYDKGQPISFTWRQVRNSNELQISLINGVTNKVEYTDTRYDGSGENTKFISGETTSKLPAGSYKLRICDRIVDGSPVCDMSDKVFTITSKVIEIKTPEVIAQAITLKSPNGGETVVKGGPLTFSWKQTNNSETMTVDILNSSNASVYNLKFYEGRGDNNRNIGKDALESLPVGQYKLKVCDAPVGKAPICDTSDAVFTLRAAPVKPVTPPVTPSANTRPNPPVISGPAQGTVGTQYNFKLKTVDPEGNTLNHAIDWNADGTPDQWLEVVGSGVEQSVQRTWNATGTKRFKVSAMDQNKAVSTWTTHVIEIKPTTPVANVRPSAPVVTGPAQGTVGTQYNFKLKTVDPEGNTLNHAIDWNSDGTPDQWLEVVGSGVEQSVQRTWNATGTKRFKVSAMDQNKAVSVWTTYTINITAGTVSYVDGEQSLASNNTLFESPNLELGMVHPAVITLQQYLNSNGYIVNDIAGEPGSIGYEADYFGQKTKQALIKFQQDKEISPAQGYFGPKTREVMGE